MLIKSVTKTTTKSAVAIWKKYEAVSLWNTWDPAVEYSELHGQFKEGVKRILKPVGGPKTEFVITDMTNYIYFADQSRLPLANIVFEHAVVEQGATREVTHTIRIVGFLAFFFKLILGKQLAKGLDEAVENLVN